jgi:excisionase family DNA binding protein
MAGTVTSRALALSEGDAALARDSGKAIARLLEDDGDEAVAVTFTDRNGARVEATLPAPAVRALARVLGEMAGETPGATPPPGEELTTHQAARFLRVSRPFLIKLLDEGKIPHRRVGTHRRVRYGDLRAYVERESAARRETLRELAAYDQEIGLYDLERK